MPTDPTTGHETRGWQPIATAPKDGTYLLLWATETYAQTARIYVGHWSTSAWWGPAWVGCEHRSETEYLKPTHWMPLPDPPASPGLVPA